MIGLSALLGLVLLIINIFVLIYLDNLEKIGCECAKDWRKTYAYVYLIVSLVYAFVIGIVFAATKSSMSSSTVSIVENIIMVLTGIMILAGILYIIFSLQYIYRLKEQKCKCAKHLTRDVWEVVLYIQVALAFLSLILILLAAFTVKDVVQKVPFYKNMKLDKLEQKITGSPKSPSKSSKK